VAISEEQLEETDFLGPAVLDEESLSEALDSIRERLRVIDARMAQLDQLAIKARKEEQFLEGLLALRRGTPADAEASRQAEVADSLEGSKVGVTTDVAQVTIGILEAARRPMHISELKTILETRGVRIPGKGTQANLIARLRRDGRIARAARGMYGLRALGIEEYQPMRRKRSRGRRKVRTQGTR